MRFHFRWEISRCSHLGEQFGIISQSWILHNCPKSHSQKSPWAVWRSVWASLLNYLLIEKIFYMCFNLLTTTTSFVFAAFRYTFTNASGHQAILSAHVGCSLSLALQFLSGLLPTVKELWLSQPLWKLTSSNVIVPLLSLKGKEGRRVRDHSLTRIIWFTW